MKQIIDAVSSEIDQKRKQLFKKKQNKNIVIRIPIWKLSKMGLGIAIVAKLGEIVAKKVIEHREKQKKGHKKQKKTRKHHSDSAMLGEEKHSESDSNHYQLSSQRDELIDDSAVFEHNDECWEETFVDFARVETPTQREGSYQLYSSQFDIYEHVCSQSFGGLDYWNALSRERLPVPQYDSGMESEDWDHLYHTHTSF